MVLWNSIPLFAIVIGLVVPGTAYRIVRVVDSSDHGMEDHMNGKVFLLNHGEASVIHHNETIIELGYSADPSKKCVAVGEKGIHGWRQYEGRLPVQDNNKVCVDTVDVSVVSRMKRGHRVPKLHHKIDNLDEALMWEMRKIDLIQGQMVYDKTFIAWMINPSVIKWHDHLILSTGITWRIRSSPESLTAGKHPSETIEFGILNISTITGPPMHMDRTEGNIARGTRKVHPLQPNTTFLGLREQVDRLDYIVGGQDPRSFVIDDRHIGLVFTNRFEYRIRMSLCILSVNMTTEEAVTWRQNSDVKVLQRFPKGFVDEKYTADAQEFFKRKDNQVPYGGMEDKGGHNLVVSHLFREFETANTKKDEKNWSPFLHQSDTRTRRLFLVESIVPLSVLEPKWDETIHEGPKAGLVPIEVVSSSTIDYDVSFWNHGGLRGGTNAVLIDDSYYLALFHSSTTIPGDGIFKSYFMGAYTFSKSMPFELMGVSALPFMDQDLYQGSYAEIGNRYYDYVVFPMTLMVEDEDTLLLSFGAQDRYGMLGRLNLQKVLRTLVPVRPGNTEIYPGHNYTAY